MPSKESIRLQWASALNRKQVFACSEHVFGRKPDRNLRKPIPQLKLGYEKKRQLLAGEHL
jgi:hypothetical protein